MCIKKHLNYIIDCMALCYGIPAILVVLSLSPIVIMLCHHYLIVCCYVPCFVSSSPLLYAITFLVVSSLHLLYAITSRVVLSLSPIAIMLCHHYLIVCCYVPCFVSSLPLLYAIMFLVVSSLHLLYQEFIICKGEYQTLL